MKTWLKKERKNSIRKLPYFFQIKKGGYTLVFDWSRNFRARALIHVIAPNIGDHLTILPVLQLSCLPPRIFKWPTHRSISTTQNADTFLSEISMLQAFDHSQFVRYLKDMDGDANVHGGFDDLHVERNATGGVKTTGQSAEAQTSGAAGTNCSLQDDPSAIWADVLEIINADIPHVQ